MNKFIWLIGAVIVAAIMWGGYWYIGASAKENGVRDWLSDRSAEGWVADSAEVATQGFPNRHDTIVRDLHLADPTSGWAWTAPELQIISLSYQPNQAIVVWPQMQTVSSPDQNITASSKDMRASIRFKQDTDLELERFTTTIDNLTLTSNLGWESHLQRAVLAARPSDTGKFAYDLAFDGENYTPSTELKRQIDGSNLLPETFEKLNIQSIVEFTAPLDKAAVEGEKPQFKRIKLNKAAARWGSLDLQAGGEVTVDANGYPTGKITLRAKNWKEMIAIARDGGAIAPELAATLESGLSVIALLSGNKDTIDAPLTFKNQQIRIGPIPIGPAPQLLIGQQ